MQTTLNRSIVRPSGRCANQPLLVFSAGLLLCFIPMILPAQTCTPTPTNIVAWWPGDGHVLDVIQLRQAVLNNATHTPGLISEGFSFGASVARVRVTEDYATDLSTMNRFTIEGWIKPTSLGNSLYPTVYSEGNRMVSLGLNKDTGRVESWLNGANRLIGTNTPIQSGQWAHVALVYDLGVARSLYVNGILAGVSNALPVADDYTGAGIGHVSVNDPNTQFLGQIDEVSLYDRALSAAEIKAIADAGAGGKCWQPNPGFVIQPTSQISFQGANVNFTGIAMGSPRPAYQWQFNGTDIPGATTTALNLTNLTFANQGDYTLVASSSAGSIASTGYLTVKFCSDTPASLVAWWPGDGSGLDVTSNYNAAVWGAVTYPPGVVSNGPAFGFNGTDAYMAVQDSPALSPHVGTNGEMSVEAWVYLTQQPSAWTTVLSKGDAGRWEYALHIDPDGVPGFYVWNPDWSTSISAVGGLITLNEWHHLVGTLKKGQFIRLYQDGALMNESTSAAINSAHGATPVYIGRRNDGYFFNGRVDEVALYGRALDFAEIEALFAGGSFGKCGGGSSPAPFFAVQPANQSGYYFLNAGLAALALGGPRPDYQWYRSNAPTVWTVVTNATTATLSFSNLSDSVKNFYYVVATNIYGSVTSSPAWLNVVCHPIVCASNGETFENGWNGWTTDSWIWQIGAGGGRGGTSGAGTVLGGNYPGLADTRLISPPFVVPADNPRLNFWHYFATYEPAPYDYGVVEIRVEGGSWQAVSPQYYYYSGVWTPTTIDLRSYAGKRVQVAFRFVSDSGGESSGWYIDDVRVATGAPIFNNPETFESGWGDWYAERGSWEIGAGGGRGGTSGAGTVLGGNYPGLADTRLISPPFVVPADNPRLNFWHYFATYEPAPYDYGVVEIRVEGGSWQAVSPQYYYYSGVWTPTTIDLRSYAGKRVQVAFRFVSDSGGESSGWYIDEVRVATGAPVFNNPETFEFGWGDWYADRGSWEIGAGGGRGGTSGAGTVLGGNYPGLADTRLISPPFVVPADNPRLNFWHYFATYEPAPYDYGVVEIRVEGGSWQAVSPQYYYYSGVWTPTTIDLRSYAGKKVQVAFRFVSDSGGESSGWYIDDVRVATGAPVFNNPETFESGWGDWYADRGSWEVPEGASYAVTANGVNYPGLADTRLVSPPFVVPADDPRLKFWHYFATYEPAPYDYGVVEIRVDGGSWQAVSPQYYYYSGVWTPTTIDLRSYAGKRVQVAFRFVSDSGGESSGWYIDEVRVATGAPVFNNPETFEFGWGDWYADRGSWEIGGSAVHSGTSSVGTVQGGNYPGLADTRLVSPPFVVPADNPRLKFWHYFATYEPAPYDYGIVEIRVEGGGWEVISPSYSGASGGVIPAEIPLSAYVGRTVQVGFRFRSDSGSESSGWYIDDPFVKRGNISFSPIANQTAYESNSFGLPSTVSFQVQVIGLGTGACATYTLPWAPKGARINPVTGEFNWTPEECQGPGVYRIPIYVVDYCNNEVNDMTVVEITVNEVNERPWLLPGSGTAYVGGTNYFSLCSGDPDCPPNPLSYSLLGSVPAGMTIDSSTGVIRWVPTAPQTGSRTVQVRLCDGGSPNYCVTNTFTIGVTTNAPYSLAVEALPNGDLQFTILDCVTTADYVLLQTSELCDCPCQISWEPVGLVSPSTSPYTFVYPRASFGSASPLFFRLDQGPRQ